MSKLVEEDVPSIEQFMSQYRVGNTVRLSLSWSYSYVTRWITLPPYTESKWESRRRSNIQAKQVPRQGNGSQRLRKASSPSWTRSNCGYERRTNYIRSCRSWSRVTLGSRGARTGREGARWSVGTPGSLLISCWNSKPGSFVQADNAEWNEGIRRDHRGTVAPGTLFIFHSSSSA